MILMHQVILPQLAAPVAQVHQVVMEVTEQPVRQAELPERPQRQTLVEPLILVAYLHTIRQTG
jgi:hypothetical protein